MRCFTQHATFDDDILLSQSNTDNTSQTNTTQSMQTPQQRYKAMKSQSLKNLKPPSEGKLKRRLAESFKKKNENDMKKLDLSKVCPKDVLKLPVFTNKYAVETIQQLIML